MNPTTLRIAAVAALAPILISACGGGEENPIASHPFLSQISNAVPDTQRTILAASQQVSPLSVAITADQLFDWAENEYAGLFPKGAQTFQLEAGGKTFTLRAYPDETYLGVADGIVYALGAFTNREIKSFGNVSDYACQVAPSACNPNPPPTSGMLNECIDHAAATLPTGFRVKLVYELSGFATGETTTESVVNGPSQFEGQSAVLVTSTTNSSVSTTVGGMTHTSNTASTTKSYEVPSTSGTPWKTLGDVTDVVTSTPATVVGGIVVVPPSSTTFSSKSVFTPPEEPLEFTLQVGKSLTQSSTVITTVTAPTPLPSATSTTTTTYTFVARESVSVFGKTYDTCRYSITEPGDSGINTTWFLAGKGVPIKMFASNGGQSTTLQLKSGTYNGAPL